MSSHTPSTSSITVRRDSTAVVVHLSGEIDISLRDEARDALAEIAEAGLPVVVDLAEVRLLGAPGIAFLLQCERICAETGVEYGVRDVPAVVARLLDVLGLGSVLHRDGSRMSMSS
ncbi:STAS domain-containing protein [Cellulomonas sp. zg-ZUI222]|uniref:STAS domain-containing protein n=1 Tax=Cellulomonas wangleii TaxID=2816956 RepID=UPI001A9530AB|nr:STAS domain-containing protein [Cellulomonas wangleii]MBO0921851.1 STAS domain-containing protein [Cellulomonas wangleii]